MKGFAYVAGIDFEEVFATVVHLELTRLILPDGRDTHGISLRKRHHQ